MLNPDEPSYVGLREKKKARTRKHISDLAVMLFIEKGYESVTVAEVAAKAEVAVTTLFNYFPTKESIIFDREDEIDLEILTAVRNRRKGQTCLDAVYYYFLNSKLIDPPNKKIHTEFMKLVKSSPALSGYFRQIWTRYQTTLAKEIQSSSNASKLEAECVATLILEGVHFACGCPNPKDALNLTFRVLKKGWDK